MKGSVMNARTLISPEESTFGEGSHATRSQDQAAEHVDPAFRLVAVEVDAQSTGGHPQ